MKNKRTMAWLLLVAAGAWLAQATPATAQVEGEQRGGTAAPSSAAPAEAAPEAPAQNGGQTPTMQDAGDGTGEAAPTDDGDVGDGEPVGDGQKGGIESYYMFIVLGGMLLLFWFMGRKPRQEEKRRQEMLSNIKKGDRVTTIGGIIGTVLEVRDKELLVKVDEASNTRMKFVRSAIRGVGEPGAEEKDSR